MREPCTGHCYKSESGADEKTIDPSGVTYIINPYDEFAVEEALKLKEKSGGDSEVIAISVGRESIRKRSEKHLQWVWIKVFCLKDDNQRDSIGDCKSSCGRDKITGMRNGILRKAVC